MSLDRCRDLVQHPNQPRPMATEATDEDDEEAHAFYYTRRHAFYHHTHPHGDRG